LVPSFYVKDVDNWGGSARGREVVACLAAQRFGMLHGRDRSRALWRGSFRKKEGLFLPSILFGFAVSWCNSPARSALETRRRQLVFWREGGEGGRSAAGGNSFCATLFVFQRPSDRLRKPYLESTRLMSFQGRRPDRFVPACDGQGGAGNRRLRVSACLGWILNPSVARDAGSATSSANICPISFRWWCS
jgi:hypothetical protein